MVSREQFDSLILLIEDGEIDDYMLELQGAINERNERRKGDIMKLVRSAFGDSAQVVTDSGAQVAVETPRVQRQVREYEPKAPTITDWPSPIESMTGGTGGVSPVADPMAEGDVEVESTGGQF